MPQLPNFSPTNAPAAAPAANTGPDIHDLHNLAPLSFWEKHGTEVIIFSGLGVLLLALLLWWVLRKKPEIPLTPYQQALKGLEFARGLQNCGKDKVFASAASDAVRNYLESAYQMPAPERTTEEFLQVAARHVWLQGELTTLLRRFLEFCDLAKFAGQQFGEEESTQLLNAAREFIEAAEKFRQSPTSTAAKSNPHSTTPPLPKPSTPSTLTAP